MSFADELQKAYDTKWAFVNTFRVQFHFSDKMKKLGVWSLKDETDMNIFIKSINTPQYTNSPIEVYIGDQWRIHNGRNEMYRFTISFRDKDQLYLYKKFIQTYNYQRTEYFNDIKMTIQLFKDGDYYGEKEKLITTYNDVMIESISQIQFSNETEAQIAEFDVEFKCTKPES